MIDLEHSTHSKRTGEQANCYFIRLHDVFGETLVLLLKDKKEYQPVGSVSTPQYLLQMHLFM